MALSQPATFNEEWSDERVFAYLNQLPPHGVNADFHVLYHAFKHMRPADYERLLTQFVADGRDVNATNPEGQRIHDVIAEFPRQSAEFLAVLAKFA
ncbi:PA4642 family protein [Acinetobacter indicus]|uniref:PA4642 family protein n=1 Tax=Acinetobacter indicus TaxID=756892 RepID=UPI0025778F25|nr:PA4642 family protein [Acinetobacter indicus]MDM1281749.1 PA4642 family protein [Acinetobacter indicus]